MSKTAYLPPLRLRVVLRRHGPAKAKVVDVARASVRLARFSRLHRRGDGGGVTRLGELRLLIRAILGHTGKEFHDDATIMVPQRRPSGPTGLAGGQ